MPFGKKFYRRFSRMRFTSRRRIPTTRRFNKRKYYNNRSKGNGFSKPVISKGIPVPDKYFTRMRYNSGQITGATGTSYQTSWSGNNLSDPANGSTGATGPDHQPYGYDQLAALYQNYRVRGAKFKVEVATETSTGAGNLMGFIHGSDDTIVNSYSLLQEMPDVRKFRCSTISSTGGGRGKAFFSTKHMFGINKFQIQDDDYTGSTDNITGPTKQWYIYFTLIPMDGTSSIDAVFDVTIEYYVEWFNKKDMAQSSLP